MKKRQNKPTAGFFATLLLMFAITTVTVYVDTAIADDMTPERDLAREAKNIALVMDWYDKAFNQRDLGTTEEVLAEDYIQHNPTLSSGRKALMDALPAYWQRSGNAKFRFLRSAAQGDLVFLHSHKTTGPDDPGRVFVDIYRVVDGKIVEHWDVSQPVPETSANENSMYE